jgi:hypothetical protein
MARHPGPLAALGAAALLICGSGCYKYVPLDAGTPAPARASDVRVFLAAPLAVPLDGITINAARRVDGEFIAMSSDSIFLSAVNVVDAGGTEHIADAETVKIGRDHVDHVELRRPALARTLLAAGGIIVFGTVTSVALTDGGGGGRSGGSGGQAK